MPSTRPPSRPGCRGLVPLLAALALAGCASRAVDSPAPGSFSAHLAPTGAGASVQGNLSFTPVADGVAVRGQVSGLQPGSSHAFHVHEKGTCADQGEAAGSHFNPTGMPHGNPESAHHHVGDMPPLQADAQGVARVDFTSRSLALSGPHSIVGRAVMVHAKPDDFNAQPAGNAGARIACGIVR